MNLLDIASLFNIPCENTLPISGVCIDSRQILSGNLFIAIRGERFDGHDFIGKAVSQGAAAVLCSQKLENIGVEQLVVPDTLLALSRIARAHRHNMPCQVIALTGSNGKTTVKEMIASILPEPSLSTEGNLNNHIGVPLSVLKLDPSHRYAVFELGANHKGEIAHTVDIVKPQVTLINNIGPAHIAGFGTIEGVANAKGEIHQGLLAEGTAIINEDDAYAHHWDAILADKKTLRFSMTKSADFKIQGLAFNSGEQAKFTLITPTGRVDIQLRIPGKHNVSNALAAAAATHALKIPLPLIAQGLNRFTGVKGRMTFLAGKHKSVIVDDTYNANLRSTLAALEVLAKFQGRRIFVFGDMGELGEWSRPHHEEVGKVARDYGIDELHTCGTYSQLAANAFGAKAQHYSEQPELIQRVLAQLNANTMVLIKGSRSSAMEKIVQQLVENN